jgi:hypothetical protein
MREDGSDRKYNEINLEDLRKRDRVPGLGSRKSEGFHFILIKGDVQERF